MSSVAIPKNFDQGAAALVTKDIIVFCLNHSSGKFEYDIEIGSDSNAEAFWFYLMTEFVPNNSQLSDTTNFNWILNKSFFSVKNAPNKFTDLFSNLASNLQNAKIFVISTMSKKSKDFTKLLNWQVTPIFIPEFKNTLEMEKYAKERLLSLFQ